MPPSPDTLLENDPEIDIILPPTDLWSDEPPLESDFHRDQIDLLIHLLKRYWCDRQDFYATGNLTIYYDENQIKSRNFRGPDFFVVLNTELKERKSWVVWAEGGKYPNLIIEILSKSTAAVDKGAKKELYQDTFRTPEYFWLDPDSLELTGFRLLGLAYQPIESEENGQLWSEQLNLYLGIYQNRLRFFTPEGELVLTAAEDASNERVRAEREFLRAQEAEQRAEEAERRAERFAAQLKALGIDPQSI